MLASIATIAVGLTLAACGDADSSQQAGQKKAVDAGDSATPSQDSATDSDATASDSGHALTQPDATVPNISLVPCSAQFDKTCPPACDVFNDADCCLTAPGCQWEADQCTCGSAP
jgi:hypothetical protein